MDETPDEQPDIEQPLIDNGSLPEGTVVSSSGWPIPPPRASHEHCLSDMQTSAASIQQAAGDAKQVRREHDWNQFLERHRIIKLAAQYVSAIRRAVNSVVHF